MSALFVCDGCDKRVHRPTCIPPADWWVQIIPAEPAPHFVHACDTDACREKVAAMKRAPALVVPF